MVSPTVTVQGVEAAAAEIQRMQAATGRDFQTVVRNLARDMTFELLARTPSAKRVRSLARKGGGYWVSTYHRHTGNRVLFVGTKQQAADYSRWGVQLRIRGRGYAKSTFLKVLRGLGLPARPVKVAGMGRRRDPGLWAEFRNNLGAVLDPSVTLGTNVPYINKLDARANILSGAVGAVAGKWQARAGKILERRVQQTTARLAASAARGIIG